MRASTLVLLVFASSFVLSLAQETKISLDFGGLVGKYGSGWDDSGILLDCQNPPAERIFLPKSNPNTVLGVLGQDPVYSQTLVRWIKLAGLTQLYNSNPVTLFIPAPYVFAKVRPDYLNSFELPENHEKLRRLLQFWVSPSYTPANKFNNGPLGSSFGQPLNLALNGSGAFLNGKPLTQVDVTATNGIIHVVGGFFEPKDLATLLADNGNFRSLLSALQSSNLKFPWNTDFTLFAPTDAAFSKLPREALQQLLANPRLLKATLNYHVVPGRHYSKSFTNGHALATSNSGQRLKFALKDYVYVNGQKLSQADVVAANGVVHVVEGVLTLRNLVEVAKDLGFNTFASAVASAGLAETLNTVGDRTVFVPTDQAFADLPAGFLANLTSPSNLKELLETLKYHTVPQQVYSDQLYTGQTLATPIGLLTVYANVSGVRVNNALITQADVVTATGVIHVVNQVLSPRTVAEILSHSAQFETLLNFFGLLNFNGLPSGGPFTVFAPTDAAFAKLGGNLTRLGNDRSALNTVVTYHVVPGIVCASQLTNGLQLTTVQGSSLTITLTSGALPKVNQANIVLLDHFGTNGIVHFVDTVLLPPNFTLP